MGVILRKKSEPAPNYPQVKDRAGFLTRTLPPNSKKYLYTAMHYGTEPPIGVEDLLTLGTAYTAYVFSEEKIIQRIPITLLALPTTSVSPPANTRIILDGVFPPHPFTLKVGEPFLLPLYLDEEISNGIVSTRPDNVAVSTCKTNLRCLTNTGYYVNGTYLDTGNAPTNTVTNRSRYFFAIEKVQKADMGIWQFKDGLKGYSGNSKLTFTVEVE